MDTYRKQTRRGVYHNLKDSTFVCPYEGITFFFATEKHLEKFEHGVEDFQKESDRLMSKRFGINVISPRLSAIKYYIMTETYGFRIIENGIEYMDASEVSVYTDGTFRKVEEK